MSPAGGGGTPAPDPLPDQVVWTAGALQRVLSERDYPALLAVSALNRAVRERGEGALEGVGTLMAALAGGGGGVGGIQRCRGLPDPVEGTLCSLEVLTPLAPVGVGRDLAEEGARFVALYLRPGEPLPPGVGGGPGTLRFGGEGTLLAPLQRYAEEALEEAWRLRDRVLPGGGDGTGSFASLVAGAVGFSPGEGREQILSRVPELRSLVREHPLLAAVDGGVRDTEALLGEYRSFLGGVTTSGRGFLGELPDSGGEVVEWAARRSFVYLASRSATLSGLDGNISERIRTVGNAAVDLRREGNAFVANLAEVGQQAALAALSGNVFALAAGVTSFFQLTPGALGGGAAGEVRALREVVESVREEMGVRFDLVDERLDDMFGLLDTRFGRLEELVASGNREVQGELRSLHQGLTALERRIDRMEANLVSYMQAGFDRDYSRVLVRCLEHRERHLPPHDRMEFPVFAECLTDFRVRGVQDARDALLTDRTTPVDDLALAEAFRDPSLENLARRLPLLARVADQRFSYQGLRGGQGGANPVEWAVAAQAYLAMLQEWPEHAASVAPGDLEALHSVGVEIQRILQGVTTDPLSGERGELLRGVLAYYDGRVAELTAEADVLARRHQQAQLRRVDPASLLARIRPLEEGRPELSTPSRMAGSVPQEVRTAAVLALEEPALVYRTATADSVARENFRRRFLFFGRRHDRLTWTSTRMEVELRLLGGEVVSAFHVTGPLILSRREEMGGGETSENVRSRREVIPDPQGHFLSEVWPTVADAADRWEATSPRSTLLQALEGAIEEELRRNETTSLNAVFTAVCQEGAPDGGLEGADRNSALRIREALDALTAARALLGAYVRLALPAVAEGELQVREMLYAPEGLLDRGGLCRTVAAGESPLRVVWLEEEPRVRAAVLAEALESALAPPGEPPTTLSLVDGTVQQLEAAIRIQRLRSLVARGPGGTAPPGEGG